MPRMGLLLLLVFACLFDLYYLAFFGLPGSVVLCFTLILGNSQSLFQILLLFLSLFLFFLLLLPYLFLPFIVVPLPSNILSLFSSSFQVCSLCVSVLLIYPQFRDSFFNCLQSISLSKTFFISLSFCFLAFKNNYSFLVFLSLCMSPICSCMLSALLEFLAYSSHLFKVSCLIIKKSLHAQFRCLSCLFKLSLDFSYALYCF